MRKIRFPRRAGIMLSFIALTISGCGDFKETHNPTVSDLSLSPEAMGEVNRISIPMPIPAPVQPPKRAEAASLWGAKTPQLFQDRRAEDVGDLVTVLIDINDRAQLQNATGRSRSSTQGVSDPDILDFNLSTSSGKVLGLSKIARVVDMFSRRLQIQETLAQQIAATIHKVTDAQGVAVIIEAKHMCMMMRGVEKQNSSMKTSATLGLFRDNQATRTEFLALLGNH